MKKINRIISLLLVLGIVLVPTNALALTKKETVFTNLDNTGNVKKNIVNNYLSFIGNETEDETTLKDVLNISGDENLTKEGNKIVFNTDGKDLTYEGVTTKELPIKVDVTYYLDNEKIDVNKLVGKKGHITIDLSFENNMYNKEYNLHTPFVVTSALILKGDKNSNIEITNGKAVNTGTRNILVGISAPGLHEDLGLSEFDLDTVSIDYDTKGFEKMDIYMVGTPKLLEESDIKYLDKLDELEKSINKLQEGTNTLEKGSNKLYNGTKKLNDGTKSLKDGINSALQGSEKLKDGSEALDNNLDKIIEGLKESKKDLDKKSKELISKLESINELKTNNTNAITKLETANEQIKSGVSAYVSAYDLDVELDVESENYQSIIDSLLASVKMNSDIYASLSTFKAQYDGNLGIITLLNVNNSTIDTLVTNLTNSSNDISTSLDTLEGYLTKLKEQGTSPIKDGQNDLYNGLNEIYNGSKKLKKGTKKLEKGSKELANGVEKLNKEGINVLTETVKSFGKYKDKINNLITLSNNYKGYASSNSDSTTFVFKINK